MSDNIQYPNYDYYVGEVYPGSVQVRLLIVITHPGSLPSIAIFDTPTKFDEFTSGRGSYCASKVLSNADDVKPTLDDFEANLVQYCQAHQGVNASAVKQSRQVKPPTPPKTPANPDKSK